MQLVKEKFWSQFRERNWFINQKMVLKLLLNIFLREPIEIHNFLYCFTYQTKYRIVSLSPAKTKDIGDYKSIRPQKQCSHDINNDIELSWVHLPSLLPRIFSVCAFIGLAEDKWQYKYNNNNNARSLAGLLCSGQVFGLDSWANIAHTPRCAIDSSDAHTLITAHIVMWGAETISIGDAVGVEVEIRF